MYGQRGGEGRSVSARLSSAEIAPHLRPAVVDDLALDDALPIVHVAAAGVRVPVPAVAMPVPVPMVVVVVLPFVLAHQVVLPLDLAEAVLAGAAN